MTRYLMLVIALVAGWLMLGGGGEGWAQTSGSGNTGAGQMQEGLLTKVVVGTTPVGTATVTVEINDQNYMLWAPPNAEFEILGEDGGKRTANELGQNVMVVRYRLRQDAMMGTVIDRIECPCPALPLTGKTN